MGLPADTPLLYVERLRYAGPVPAALMQNWLPPQFADLADEDLAGQSMYALLRTRGVRPVIAHQTIGARRPRPNERKLLGLAAGDPLLTMSRRAYAADGSAVEFGPLLPLRPVRLRPHRARALSPREVRARTATPTARAG